MNGWPIIGARTASVIAAIIHGLTFMAQSNCVTLKDETDEFTRSYLLNISVDDHADGPAFDWLVKDDVVCLRMHWERSTGSPAVVFEGDTLLLKLENEQIMALKSSETTIGHPTLSGENKITKGTYSYLVDHEQLALIGHFWVQKMRIHFRDGHDEFDATTNAGWQTGLWRSANCLRQAMGLKPMPEIISGFEAEGSIKQ